MAKSWLNVPRPDTRAAEFTLSNVYKHRSRIKRQSCALKKRHLRFPSARVAFLKNALPDSSLPLFSRQIIAAASAAQTLKK